MRMSIILAALVAGCAATKPLSPPAAPSPQPQITHVIVRETVPARAPRCEDADLLRKKLDRAQIEADRWKAYAEKLEKLPQPVIAPSPPKTITPETVENDL